MKGRVTVAIAALAAVAASSSAAAPNDGPSVRVATTGDHSERVKTLPITRRRGAEPRVVMSMSPATLPDLERGDRLRVTAEMQVTNNCNFRSPRCVGPVYHFGPHFEGRLILAPDAATTSGSRALPISGVEGETCSQKRPDYEHHCVLVFTRAGLTIPSPDRLPCPVDRCFVNLVASADHPRAQAGDLLMVGGQRPDGSIPQDRGRINVIRLRGVTAADARQAVTHRHLVGRVPPDLHKRVVYSLRLNHLRAGEQLGVRATVRTDISELRYAVRSSTRVILADSPDAVRQGAFVRSRASQRGEISENNGSNCTRDEGTCTYRKVGVLEMRRDAVDSRGRPVPLYVNVITVYGPKVQRARPDDRVRLRRGGIEATRYPARLNR